MAAALATGLRRLRLPGLSVVALPLSLFVLAAISAATKPIFLSPDNLLSIIHQVSIVGIMAIGMTFVIMTGGIDLSVGPVLAVAGVVTAELLAGTGDNVGAAIVGALAVATAIGLIQGLFVAQIGLPPIVVTLAGLSMVRGGALLFGGPELHLIRGPESYLFIGSGLIGAIPVSAFIFGAVIIAGVFLQRGTRFGLSVLAIGDNERASFLSGLRIRTTKTAAYSICALTAGIAGVIQASQVHTAAATYGVGIELDVISAVVLGGTSLMGGSGSVVRTVMGVFLIGILNNGLGLHNVPFEMQLIAKGIVIVIALSLSSREWINR